MSEPSQTPTVTLPCGCTAQATSEGVAGTPVCQPHISDPRNLGFAIAALSADEKALLLQKSSATPSTAPSNYSGDPASSLIDAVRYTIRDTGPKFTLTDAEVAYLLAENSNNVTGAALAACVSLQARFAGAASSEAVGSVSFAFGNAAQNYAMLANQLRRKIAVGAGVYAGGVNRYDKMSKARDRQRTRPYFTRQMLQEPLGDWYGDTSAIFYAFDILDQ